MNPIFFRNKKEMVIRIQMIRHVKSETTQTSGRKRSTLLRKLCALLVVAFCTSASASAEQLDAATNVAAGYSPHFAVGIRTLQNWYVESSGLYQKPTDWWNSANAITVLVDYSRATHTTQYLSAVANTFLQANKAYGTTNF